LAILLVFVFHYCIISQDDPHWIAAASRLGWTGVDLFFVLSGFLIASQLFEEINKTQRFSYRNFLIKRSFRILPAYWFTVALYFSLPAFHEKEALPPLWKFLTFTQNFGLNVRYYGTFSHAWSLCVEEHFYLLLPLILLALLPFPKIFRKAYWLLPLLLLAVVCLRRHGYSVYNSIPEDGDAPLYWYRAIYYPTYCRLDGLLAGVGLAAIHAFRPLLWNKIARLGNWHLVFCILTFIFSYIFISDQQSMGGSVLGFLFVALGFSFLLLAATSERCYLYKRRSKATAFIAAISYTLYLTHKGVIHLTREWLLPLHVNPTLLLFLCLLASIGAAWLLRMVLEKPFLKWRDQLLHRFT